MLKGIFKDYVAYCEACSECRKAHRKGSTLWQIICLAAIYWGMYVGITTYQLLEKEK